MDKHRILIIDSILVFGILLSIFFLFEHTQPLAIAPLSSENQDLLFSLPSVDYILIDDNSQFNSPETIFISQTINLDKGRYFIKFFDGLKSEIREVDLQLDVALQFKELDNGDIGVFNLGDSNLLVDVYDTGSLVNSGIAYLRGQNE